MKKIVFAAMSAALLGLSACAEEAEDTTVVETETMDPAADPAAMPADPAAAGAMGADATPAPDATATDGADLSADVTAGDTTVSADVDADTTTTN